MRRARWVDNTPQAARPAPVPVPSRTRRNSSGGPPGNPFQPRCAAAVRSWTAGGARPRRAQPASPRRPARRAHHPTTSRRRHRPHRPHRPHRRAAAARRSTRRRRRAGPAFRPPNAGRPGGPEPPDHLIARAPSSSGTRIGKAVTGTRPGNGDGSTACRRKATHKPADRNAPYSRWVASRPTASPNPEAEAQQFPADVGHDGQPGEHPQPQGCPERGDRTEAASEQSPVSIAVCRRGLGASRATSNARSPAGRAGAEQDRRRGNAR